MQLKPQQRPPILGTGHLGWWPNGSLDTIMIQDTSDVGGAEDHTRAPMDGGGSRPPSASH